MHESLKAADHVPIQAISLMRDGLNENHYNYYGQAARPISISQLNTLLCLHT